jgi:hypothetical protein
LEACWQSGGPDYLFTLMLALGAGGLALVLSPLARKQPRPGPVGRALVWAPRISSLAVAVMVLVGLGFPDALQTLVIYAAVFGVVWVALRLGPRSEVAAGECVRLWPVSRTNLSVWLGAVMLTAAVLVFSLQGALGHPCA